MFVGRLEELKLLNSQWEQQKATLVVCRGRRRIGKSELIRKFSLTAKHYYEFQGLAPRAHQTSQHQIDNFYKTISIRQPKEATWTTAFEDFTEKIKKQKRVLIFFDEISWMGNGDPDFAGILKIAWDTHFSKMKNTILVLCGSISSWIEENILSSTAFVGRVSLTLSLEELNLKDSLLLLKNSQSSNFEKLKMLSLTGGVPKYLEELNLKQSLFENTKQLFFSKEGFLFNDFNQVFNDIFLKKAKTYKDILELLIEERKTLSQIADGLKIKRGGLITNYLFHLKLSGFIAEDYNYSVGAKKGKTSYFRIKDNYLRFYLKYVEPKKDKIESGLFAFNNFSQLKGWETILGLQFENLIYANRIMLLKHLNIDLARVKSFSSYFQKKTARTQGGCQIDLLLELEGHEFIIFEIKLRTRIPTSIIADINQKKKLLKRPAYYSVRTALIYAGELINNEEFENKLDYVISIDELLA